MNMQQNNISENNFEQCIKCTVCTVYCPVIPVNPEYPGPKQAGPDEERLRLKRGEYFDEALKYCLNCKRCEVACPSNVKIGDIIQLARIKYSKKKPALRDIMLANTDFVGTMASAFAPIVNTTLSLKPVNGNGRSPEDRPSSCVPEVFFPDIRELVQKECDGFAG